MLNKYPFLRKKGIINVNSSGLTTLVLFPRSYLSGHCSLDFTAKVSRIQLNLE
jgi:hypothetical protein